VRTTEPRRKDLPIPALSLERWPADQAALYGLLNRVCDLGLVLISVRRVDPGRSREEDILPPAILRQLAAAHIRALVTEVGGARSAHEACRAGRHR